MKQKEKQEPGKWEVYNRITGEVVSSGLSKREADDELEDMYCREWKDCDCILMEDLLESGFPYEKRKMGKGWYRASKEMVDAWTEYQRIGKEFCDAWNNAPTRDEGRQATEELWYYYTMEWLMKVGDREAMERYFLPYYESHGEWPEEYYGRKWGNEINLFGYECIAEKKRKKYMKYSVCCVS